VGPVRSSVWRTPDGQSTRTASADVRDPSRIEGLAAYDRGAVNAQPRGRLHHDARRFVLRYHGGSIDIDGSTVYYDSQVGQWRLFHNDDKEAEAQLERLTEGLKECKVGPGSAD